MPSPGMAPPPPPAPRGDGTGPPAVSVGRTAGRRGRARSSALDDLASALADATHPVIVLLPPTEGHREDIRIRCLVDAARAVRIALPEDPAAAEWCVAVARELSPADHHAVVRALEVLCNGPDVVERAPRRSWGPHGIGVPALRPVTLARWASCAWVPCSWCARGGAVGHPCLRCGAPIRPPALGEAAT